MTVAKAELATWLPGISCCTSSKLLLGVNLHFCFLSFCKLSIFGSLINILVSGVKYLMQLKLIKIQPGRLAWAVLSESEAGCSWQSWCRGHSHEIQLENVLCGKQKDE